MANQKFCRCEPGDFPDTHFYTDPYNVEVHVTGPGIRGHYTSTCDEYIDPHAPRKTDPGEGPAIAGMAIKLLLGPIVSGEMGPGTLDLSDPDPQDLQKLVERMTERSIPEVVQMLYRTDKVLGAPQPFPQPVVSAVRDAILGKEMRQVSLLARSGEMLRGEINKRLVQGGIMLSSTNYERLIDFITGDFNAFKR